jgi:hypothetical protein
MQMFFLLTLFCILPHDLKLKIIRRRLPGLTSKKTSGTVITYKLYYSLLAVFIGLLG